MSTPKIRLTATWGNGDAESSITLSQGQLKKIKTGATYTRNAYSYYEGARHRVNWAFENQNVVITGTDDGGDWFEGHLEDLSIGVLKSG